MAQHKRKRNSTRPKPNKRPKYRDSSGSEPIDDTLWAAERILAEAVVRGVKKYHIKWKGIDPNTGKKWPSTWEPEGNANELLVTAWEAEKAHRLEQERKEREEQRQEVEAARRIRNLRVIESSPESDTRSSSTVTPPEPAHDEAGPKHQSSTATTPVADRAPPVRPSPVIQIRRRSSSLEREEFEAFSQLLSSQATSAPIASAQVYSQDSNLDSSQLFAARPRPYSSGIVPDSQSSTGEATFIPITQQTEDTIQQSTGSSTLTEEEELVDDSCLGEIVQGAAPDVVSPARSIPETIPDTTVADTESQHQGDLGAFELAPNLSHPEDTTIEDHVEAIAESEPHTDISPCTDSNTSTGSERVEQDQEQVLRTQTAETAQTNPLVFVDIEEIPISPGKPSTTLGDSQILTADVRDADRDVPQVVAGIFGEEAHPPQEAGVRDSQPSLAEHSISEDKQFLFHSQHHICDFQQQAPSSRPAFAQEDRNGSSQHSADTSAALTTQAEQALTGPATQSKAVSHSAYDPQRQSTSLPVQSKAQEHSLSKSLAISNLLNPLPQERSCSPEVREQNAQIVSLEAVLSTQEESPHSIRSTIEKEYSKKRQNSESRHDSSQETPERSSGSSNHSSSPLPYPPSQSLITQASKPPLRPRSPLFSSSPFIMSNESTAELIKRQMEEALAKQKAQNPYIPKRRNNRGSTTPSSSAPEGSTASQANRLLRTAEQEGTRSPSVVPDRSPAVQVPTSLRTVAYAPTVPQTTPPPDDTKVSPSDAPSEPAEAEVAAPTQSAAPDVPPSAGSDQMDVSDADDEDNNEDNESLLNDDLQLAWAEFIVPLYIQGRQSDMYSQCIASKKEILDQFLDDPSSVEPVSQVEEVLSYLRAVETHIDLVFAEAGTSFSNNEMSSTQTEHAAQFGMENSTKFRFLHELFNFLRDTDTHVVITTEKADEALFKILETFCRANKVHFDMPTRGVQGSLEEATGKMNVSIIPQNGSPIMRFSDLIICLDGVQDATEIRKKLWAQSTEREYVPIIHLVIPRTVGHIERYVSPNLDPVERMHTILASLAHMRADIGRPIFEDTPRDTACAALICEWLQNSTEDEDYEWPIPSIGSIKDVIEYQTQMSQPLANSPIPERAKRPLVQEELDPVKRMRYTPQPQPVQSSTVNQNNEVTRISDSMPGTSAVESDLRKQLTRMEEMYYAERAARKAEEKRFREHEEMWDKQQTVHENLMNEYRVLSQKQKAAEIKLETLTKTNTILTERLQARTAEVRELEKQLAEQRATHLLSADAQIVEITKLRTELAASQQEKDKAVKGAATSDDLLEYTRNAYQDAQNIAATSNARIAELEAQGLKLTQAASDQASKLKGLHLDRNYELQEKHIRTLKAELNIVKKALQNKDEEVTRLKSLGRQGVGTRGTSATPQPKIRSRAGSPSLVGGRLANLRNG